MHGCTVGNVFDEKMQKKVGENARAPSESSLSSSFATVSIAAGMLLANISRLSDSVHALAIEDGCG
jgi:hypothetical protein